MRLKRKNSHPIQLPCQPKKPATLPQSQKKRFNICHNLANNPKEVFIKREKEEKDDTLKMTSTSEQDTQPFFNENITPLPQNTTIPITSGTCDEPKMQKTTSTTILSTAKECDQLIPVSLTDDNCPDPKSWLHPQDPGKKSDTLKAIAINKETSAILIPSSKKMPLTHSKAQLSPSTQVYVMTQCKIQLLLTYHLALQKNTTSKFLS